MWSWLSSNWGIKLFRKSNHPIVLLSRPCNIFVYFVVRKDTVVWDLDQDPYPQEKPKDQPDDDQKSPDAPKGEKIEDQMETTSVRKALPENWTFPDQNQVVGSPHKN